MWRIDDPQGNEAAKIRFEIVPYTGGRGLDLGCGPHKAFPHFIGVDNGHHAEAFGWQMKPDVHVNTCANLGFFSDNSMDFVFSSHLLEHMEDLRASLEEWFRVVKVGGHMVLYCPDDKLYPLVGTEGANPDHKHNLNQAKVTGIMKDIPGWDLVVDELRDQDHGPGDRRNEYSFFQVYQKIEGRKHQYSCQAPRPDRTAAVVRYGAFGDAIQASSILPALKEAGYHITFYTTPRGYSVLRENPHIDDWVIQEKDQVPNHELHEYWAVQSHKYDIFINLSESVEGTLLAMPNRTNHAWPHKVRHAMMDINYWEMTHSLAGVPMPPRSKFYPTQEEVDFAMDLYDQCKGGQIILWVLRGSSPHKVSLYMDQVLAKLLVTKPNAHVITVGDGSCQLLERGWEEEPRVHCMAGKMTIRQTMALAQLVDVVVGPETGVLSAVAFEENVAKVVMLSHSSPENLTKRWPKTTALMPDPLEVPCYPCHQLHYDWTHCNVHTYDEQWCQKNNVSIDTGLLEPGVKVAKCSAYILPEMIFQAIVSQECFEDQKLKLVEA